MTTTVAPNSQSARDREGGWEWGTTVMARFIAAQRVAQWLLGRSTVRPYANGSVPYGSVPGNVLVRAVCSWLNHYPRSETGSWAWGYGYVCGRCQMYADPWSASTMAAAVAALPPTASNHEAMMIVRRIQTPHEVRAHDSHARPE